MNEVQLNVRDFILRTGLIPEPYNLLIINGAMQEGWNLYDDKVTLAILDTVDITEQTQSLGRIRKDIDIVIKKTKDKNINNFVEVPTSYLKASLDSSDKQVLCEELYLLDDKGKLRKWPTVKKHILESGYYIEDKTSIIDGKHTRISIITIKK